MGDLVHMILDRALRALEANGGLATRHARSGSSPPWTAPPPTLPLLWETERAVPPRVIWRRTLDEARDLSARALAYRRRAAARRPRLWRGAVRRGRAQVRVAPAVGSPAAASRFPAPASGSPAISIGSTSPATAAARWCATTRPAGRPEATSCWMAARSCSAASMPSP